MSRISEQRKEAMEKAVIKSQRNYCLEMYNISYQDMEVYDKIYEGIVSRWRKLNEKPQKEWDLFEKYEAEVLLSEHRIYGENLKRIRDKIRDYNEDLSRKIIEYNIKLGYDEFDLTNDLEDDMFIDYDESSDDEIDNDKLKIEDKTQPSSENNS